MMLFDKNKTAHVRDQRYRKKIFVFFYNVKLKIVINSKKYKTNET